MSSYNASQMVVMYQILSEARLALRGHESLLTFGGNLYQLLLLLAEDHVGMKTWLQQRDCISPEIVAYKHNGASCIEEEFSRD